MEKVISKGLAATRILWICRENGESEKAAGFAAGSVFSNYDNLTFDEKVALTQDIQKDVEEIHARRRKQGQEQGVGFWRHLWQALKVTN